MTVTSKPARFDFRILAAALTLFSTVACSTQTSSTANAESSGEKAIAPTKVSKPTTFTCKQQESDWATFAQRGILITKVPFITWKTTEFGSKFIPEDRCKIVSQKLTEVVAKNGGSLRQVQLTTGQVKGQTVVCVTTPEQKSCNSNNMLFTLSEENAKNPSKALVQITKFAHGNSDSKSIEESGQFPSEINLETLVNPSLPEGSGL